MIFRNYFMVNLLRTREAKSFSKVVVTKVSIDTIVRIAIMEAIIVRGFIIKIKVVIVG